MPRRLFRPLTIAVIAFLIGSAIDYSTDLEIKLGLSGLFRIRGERQTPKEIVVVAMDEQSDIDRSGGDFTLWRRKHAELIGQLHKDGAAFIVFDLYFNAPQPAHDPALAKAMRTAGNVLATDCIQTEVNAWTECGNKPGPLNQPPPKTVGGKAVSVKLNQPIPPLADALLDHAPFFLSNDPDNPTLRQGWNFIDEHRDEPTLPVVLWFYTLERKGALPKTGVTFSKWLAEQRSKCLHDENQPSQELTENPARKQQIRTIICQNQNRYLDFYGPPASFRTVSYSDVLDGKAKDFADKVVFVGQTSRRQADSFLTPFTDTESGRMVGVEVMATQYANILEGRDIAPLIPLGSAMLFYGLVVSAVLTLLPGLTGIAASLLFTVTYFITAVWQFSLNGSWLPVAVPLLLQLPLTWLLSLYGSRLDQLKEAKILKAKIDQVTAENDRLINQFIERLHDADTLSLSLQGEGLSEKLSGVCLVSDIEGFTNLAELIQPDLLFDKLRRYFNLLGAIISSHGGKIANISGDGMVAIWVESPLARPQQAACLATLEISRAVDRFNSATGSEPFFTRFGLHEGEFALGRQVGDKLDGNPIGDAVNTAARLESLNKRLGTRILASATVIAKASNVLVRPLGAFQLTGKNQPIELIEIVDLQSESGRSRLPFCTDFERGLKHFRKGQWRKAEAIFHQLLERYGYDGPTHYYLQLIEDRNNPPPEWNGYVKLDTK